MRESCRTSERKYQLKVEAMESITELLLVTLADLSPQELNTFNELFLRRHFLKFKWMHLEKLELKKVVFSVVLTHGGQSVEVVEKIFKSMNRMDLVDQMEDSSSRAKKKRFDEPLSAEIHTVSAVAATKDLVLETLTDLKEREFLKFKWFLQLTRFQKGLPQIPWSGMEFANRAELVNMMWTTCGDQCLQVTEEVLLDMRRSDLVEKLPVGSSSFNVKLPVKHFWPELKQKVKDMESEIKLLLENLDFLTFRDLKDILNFLSWDQSNSPYLSVSCWLLGMKADLQDTLVLMVHTNSHNPVDHMEDLFKRMKRADLQFAVTQSTEKKLFERKRSSALIQKAATMAAVKKLLLETFNCLHQAAFEDFKMRLQRMVYQEGFSVLETGTLAEIKSKQDLVNVMVVELGPSSVEKTRTIFMDMNRTDLLKRLPETSSGMKEPPSSLDPVGCGRVEQDSSSWTTVDPEVDGTSLVEGPTYSLQSEAGLFECRVSGLRWVCKEKVCFRYRFCSWDGHLERMESRGFRPAGPLMDITVFSGKMMEVQLPHWVCIDDVPDLSDNFAVLHVNDCGDVVEKVTRVSATHVSLTEPVFSLLGNLMNYLFSPKITCNTLIYYQPKTSFLKLRVYLIHPDPAVKQRIHREESSSGYEEIKKPRPDKPLKMDQGFTLKATVETAKIQPPEITLRHNSLDPNFYEVFIENPDGNFHLELLQACSEKVWFCEIRKDDHPKSGFSEVGGSSTEAVAVKTEGEHFVKKYSPELIQKVRNIGPILDGLLQKKVLQQEAYNEILSLATTQSQMRKIFTYLSTSDAYNIFLRLLQKMEPALIAYLEAQK